MYQQKYIVAKEDSDNKIPINGYLEHLKQKFDEVNRENNKLKNKLKELQEEISELKLEIITLKTLSEE